MAVDKIKTIVDEIKVAGPSNADDEFSDKWVCRTKSNKLHMTKINQSTTRKINVIILTFRTLKNIKIPMAP